MSKGFQHAKSSGNGTAGFTETDLKLLDAGNAMVCFSGAFLFVHAIIQVWELLPSLISNTALMKFIHSDHLSALEEAYLGFGAVVKSGGSVWGDFHQHLLVDNFP